MSRYAGWQKDMMQKCVDCGFVKEHEKDVILELDFYYLTELVDIQPKGGECIHSMSEPFEEDPISQIADDVLDNWASHFHMNRHQLHASGHAGKDEIFGMIGEIKPKSLYPVHTHSPDLFPKHLDVKKGEKVEL